MILKWLTMFLLQGFITHAYNDAVRQRQGELFENDSGMFSTPPVREVILGIFRRS